MLHHLGHVSSVAYGPLQGIRRTATVRSAVRRTPGTPTDVHIPAGGVSVTPDTAGQVQAGKVCEVGVGHLPVPDTRLHSCITMQRPGAGGSLKDGGAYAQP